MNRIAKLGMLMFLVIICIAVFFNIHDIATVTADTTKNVSFKDKKLENAIRKLIKKPSGVIRNSDVKNIKELYLSKAGISSLIGIENLANLTRLDLDLNRVNDLRPLKGLINLTELRLTETGINSIDELKYLTKLEKLFLYNNQICSIEALRNLKNLKVLYLRNNKIVDYSPLDAYIHKLEDVDFKFGQSL